MLGLKTKSKHEAISSDRRRREELVAKCDQCKAFAVEAEQVRQQIFEQDPNHEFTKAEFVTISGLHDRNTLGSMEPEIRKLYERLKELSSLVDEQTRYEMELKRTSPPWIDEKMAKLQEESREIGAEREQLCRWRDDLWARSKQGAQGNPATAELAGVQRRLRALEERSAKHQGTMNQLCERRLEASPMER